MSRYEPAVHDLRGMAYLKTSALNPGPNTQCVNLACTVLYVPDSLDNPQLQPQEANGEVEATVARRGVLVTFGHNDRGQCGHG